MDQNYRMKLNIRAYMYIYKTNKGTHANTHMHTHARTHATFGQNIERNSEIFFHNYA